VFWLPSTDSVKSLQQFQTCFVEIAVPSPRGGFGGLSPSKQSSNPPKLTYETMN